MNDKTAHGYLGAPARGGRRRGREGLGGQLDLGFVCRFRNRGTEYASESGIKWRSGGAKRRCDQALA